MDMQTMRDISRTIELLKIQVIKLLLSADKKCMPRRLAQRTNLSDLEWPFQGLSVPSVWERRANVNALCTSTSTLKSTSSASRAISAVAEQLVCFPVTVNM